MKTYGDFTTSLYRALDEIDPDWPEYNGLIVAGSHSPEKHDPEEIIEEIRIAQREKKTTLLICFGHQLGAIWYARDILGIQDATSEEFGKKGTFVVKYKGMKVGLYEGESYWNQYEVDIDYQPPEHFVSTQAHPEFESAIGRPHPLLVKFLNMFK